MVFQVSITYTEGEKPSQGFLFSSRVAPMHEQRWSPPACQSQLGSQANQPTNPIKANLCPTVLSCRRTSSSGTLFGGSMLICRANFFTQNMPPTNLTYPPVHLKSTSSKYPHPPNPEYAPVNPQELAEGTWRICSTARSPRSCRGSARSAPSTWCRPPRTWAKLWSSSTRPSRSMGQGEEGVGRGVGDLLERKVFRSASWAMTPEWMKP